jgi:hypothetical protein
LKSTSIIFGLLLLFHINIFGKDIYPIPSYNVSSKIEFCFGQLTGFRFGVEHGVTILITDTSLVCPYIGYIMGGRTWMRYNKKWFNSNYTGFEAGYISGTKYKPIDVYGVSYLFENINDRFKVQCIRPYLGCFPLINMNYYFGDNVPIRFSIGIHQTIPMLLIVLGLIVH